MDNMVVIGVIGLLLLGVYVYRKFTNTNLSARRRVPVSYRYRREEHVMTHSEYDFYTLLVDAFGNDYYIFPQVHLSAIFNHKITGQNWKAALNHINGKSVDYVICDKLFASPLVAIELDDPSHEKEDRQKRDSEVERIFAESDLPLLRFKNTLHTPKQDIISQISAKL